MKHSLIAIVLILALAWAGTMDYADAINADTAAKEARIARVERARELENCARHAEALAHLANGGPIVFDDMTITPRRRMNERMVSK